MISRPPYAVRVKKSAEKELGHLAPDVIDRVLSALLGLETDPRPATTKRLRGTGEYRLRVGSYRILYTIDDEKRSVQITAVGHRSDVYRHGGR